MVWRWVIRGLAAALLAACVVAWVGSYRRTLDAGYIGKGVHVWVYFSAGRMNFAHAGASGGDGLYWHLGYGMFDWSIFNGFEHWGIGGFGLVHNGDTDWLVLPLWFPTLVSAGVLGLAWWKSRTKREARGFPVEVAGGTGQGEKVIS